MYAYNAKNVQHNLNYRTEVVAVKVTARSDVDTFKVQFIPRSDALKFYEILGIWFGCLIHGITKVVRCLIVNVLIEKTTLV